MPSELTEPRLKQVSVLFTDVVGSTALGGRLDPEDIHDIMDMALRRFSAIVASHGGRVLKYTGDGLLAAFGTEVAQEDDAERAVRAGLAFLDEARRIAVEVRRDYARAGVEGFDIRVGVDTGPVLLGGGVEAEANIRGTVVNMAARMEQSAPTAALRISHATHQQVRGLFDVLEQKPIRVKGSDEPLVTYLVERVRPHAFRKANRGVQGLTTALVGRDVELARLAHALSTATDERRCVGVTVVAEAGVGKSRLLYEFEDRARMAWAQLRPFRSRAQPQSVHRPFGLLRDVITSGLDLPEGTGVEAAGSYEQCVVDLLATGDGTDAAKAHAHVLGQLIGFDFSGSHHLRGILEDPRQIRNRAFNAAAQVIRRVQARDGAPVVLLLDDLHWADEGSLDFIDHLVRVDHDVPILVLGLTRPEFFDRRPKWGSRMKSHVRLDLPTLEARSRSELADALLQKFDPVPGRLRALLVDRSEGNPFYMEELLKMLIDAGSIVVDGDRWRLVAEALDATAVPATLTGVIQARLDRLAPQLRATLQQASVIGPVFWDRAIAALDVRAVESLEPLAQRAFIVAAERSAFGGMREFAFAHHILHQVTYDGVLRKARREYHARAAAWLASVVEQGAGDHCGAVAEHFERAGDPANAVVHYTRAAERAAARYAHQAVSAYATRGLAHITPQDDETRWLLLLLRQRALRFQGAMLAQGQDLDALQAIADAANDDSRRATVLLRRAVALKETGDSRAAVTMARQSQVLAQALGLARVELSSLSTLSGALRSLGEHSEARRAAQEALALAHRIGDRAVEAECLTNLAAVANEQGDYAASAKLLRQSLPIERAMENRQGECAALINLGDSEYRLGDYASARRDLEEALRLARSIGTRGLESVALLNLSSVAHFQLDNEHALEYGQSAVAIAQDIANREYEAFARIGLGHACLGLGDFDQARDAFARAHDLLLSLEMPHLAVEAESGLAQVALEQGANDEALVHVNNVLAHIDRVGNLDGTEHPLLIRLICFRALTASGDPRAASMLASARAELSAKADAISDPQSRRKLLQDVPYNREIEALGGS